MLDFGVLCVMLFYVDEFFECLYYKKESELFFLWLCVLVFEMCDMFDDLDVDYV